ncbi:MAG: glycosyltransferase family 4 protein [Planctomycetes bacterium]|nr:glycosyltransferase family 4 protein [Planctomycetota bacterium]
MARHDLMRLDLVVNIRFPGTRANGIQVAAMAEALADTGLAVDVVVPRRLPRQDLDPYAHYGVRRIFAVQRIANIDLIDLVPPRLQRVPFLLQSLTFGLRALARAAVERDAGILVRDHYTLELLVRGLREPDVRRLASEVHDLPDPGPRRARVARALAKLPAVVTISDALKSDLVDEGVPADSILVARDGVHLRRFERLPSKQEARRHLDLEASAPLVVYAGQLYPWKGVDTLVEAVGGLPGVRLLVVGGDRRNLSRIEALVARHAPGRVTLSGPVPHERVPFYLAAGDVVVLPNSGREEISARYTSPLKLFEAMATGRPLLATDLPSLREVLEHGRDSHLVPPDDPAAMAAGLRALLDDPERAERLAATAREEVEAYDWLARGRQVARFLRDRLAVGV